jgi:hypothetical protein
MLRTQLQRWVIVPRIISVWIGFGIRTSSATGEWNTKNHGANISTKPHKRGFEEVREEGCKMGDDNEDDVRQPRTIQDLINVKVANVKVKGSNLTRNGNGNSVKLHVAGNGDHVVNVTVAWEGEESNFEDSVSNNTDKIYLNEG